VRRPGKSKAAKNEGRSQEDHPTFSEDRAAFLYNKAKGER
jgi:hypothetical protein